MLNSLHIKNLALIDNALVEFGPGLNVITGESGAGKSLIIRALALTLGARADKDDIGARSNACVVEATFTTTVSSRLKQALKEFETDFSSTMTVTLRREISHPGRSRCFINDRLSNLERLNELGESLFRLQGQSSSALLRNAERQLQTLDDFAGVSADVETLAEHFDEWELARAALRRLEANRENLQQERELLQFQEAELTQANLSVEEEDTLNTERKRLDAAERLIRSCESISFALASDDSPVESLSSLKKLFADVARSDDSFKECAELFNSAVIQLEEARRSVEEYRSSLFVDDERLHAINERLSEIYRLKTKYGGSVSAALDKLAGIRKRLKELPDVSAELRRLAESERRAFELYSKYALKIRTTRLQSAPKLAVRTREELNDLAIPRNVFDFRFTWEENADGVPVKLAGRTARLKPERFGLESGQFFFSANPGEEPRALSRVASGGEMSRALLALDVARLPKSAKKKATYPACGFDEVDTGVSGATAIAMGKKLKELASRVQTIVVTHLPQVVSFADRHLLVEKKRSKNRNHVSVRVLSKEESREQCALLASVEEEPVL